MKKIISVLVACACILSALPIAFLTVADNEPSVAHTGDNSLQVYNFVHTAFSSPERNPPMPAKISKYFIIYHRSFPH